MKSSYCILVSLWKALTNLFSFLRLCQSKQSKVYLPEPPFPHAEVHVQSLALVLQIYKNPPDLPAIYERLPFWIVSRVWCHAILGDPGAVSRFQVGLSRPELKSTNNSWVSEDGVTP